MYIVEKDGPDNADEEEEKEKKLEGWLRGQIHHFKIPYSQRRSH